jgi:teichuronic acid biosynthesis glycosyltransferase TuaG
MHDDLISVIIPTYNSEKYIINTLNSVYEQTCLPYEIVVCDDGSTDGTAQLVREYFDNKSDIISRTKLIVQKNKGAGAARNNAIKNTTGNWIAFLDSDDRWLPNKLEKVQNIISQYDEIGIITHNEYNVRENNLEEKTVTTYSKWYNPEKNLFIQLFENCFFSTCCMVVKKKLIEDAGYFDESLLSSQDYDLWLRISHNQRVYIIKEPLAYYLIREGNISSNTYRRYLCEMKIIKKNMKYIYEMLGKRNGSKIVRRKIYKIHIGEGHAALVRRQLDAAVRIAVRMIPSMLKV